MNPLSTGLLVARLTRAKHSTILSNYLLCFFISFPVQLTPKLVTQGLSYSWSHFHLFYQTKTASTRGINSVKSHLNGGADMIFILPNKMVGRLLRYSGIHEKLY